MRVKLIKHEATVASMTQEAVFQENVFIIKEAALAIAREYDHHIKIEISTNPEKTNAKINVMEFNL